MLANRMMMGAAGATGIYHGMSNGSLLDEDFADISDWADDDGTDGTSSQVTFDSKSCLKLDSGSDPDNNQDRATRSIDFGDTPSGLITLSYSVYHSAIGTRANGDYFTNYFQLNTERLLCIHASDGFFINLESGGYTELGTNIVSIGVWQEWTFYYNPNTKLCEVYLDEELVAKDLAIDIDSSMYDGYTESTQYGSTTANRISYLDWLKVGDGYA